MRESRVREMFFAGFDKLIEKEGNVVQELRICIGRGRKERSLQKRKTAYMPFL